MKRKIARHHRPSDLPRTHTRTNSHCGRQELNLHVLWTLEPESSASANSATAARRERSLTLSDHRFTRCGVKIRGRPTPSAQTKQTCTGAPRLRLLLFTRYFGSGLPRLGQADRDRLLTALHRFAGTAAFQRPLLPLVHRPLHLRSRFLAVLCHGNGPFVEAAFDPTADVQGRERSERATVSPMAATSCVP
jgi:hypothetical protein